MEELRLSTAVLEWAAKEAGQSYENLATSLIKRSADLEKVLLGKLTVSQAEKFAKKTRIPFGFLFLDSPPNIGKQQIPDLRQTTKASSLSQDFFDVLEDVGRKQQWFIEYIREHNEKGASFVGRFSISDNPIPEKIAHDIRRTLKLTIEDRKTSKTTDAYFSILSEKAEKAGILVFKSGIVRSNTKRPLSVDEFRGFALADPIVPLVFVNGRDIQVAAVFTLAHELAHIWLGESGVSDLSVRNQRKIEQVCNAVAGELLIPREEFLALWEEEHQSIEKLSAYFKVSRLAFARRALDLGKITRKKYEEVAKQTFHAKPASSGGNPYRTIPIRNSKKLTKALVSSAMSGDTLLREAASLLNIKTDTVVTLARELHYD